MEWDEGFRQYIEQLLDDKPVIIGGDFNVALHSIDVYPENLRVNESPAGFMEEEKDGFAKLLECELIDVFRHLYPEKEGAYTWWSNRFNMREKNQGWRIDYFLVSKSLLPKAKSMVVRSDVPGSDHCPIELEIML